MIDYGALPPEVNSTRMYTGPGAGPMLAAATAWDVLADELSLTASSFESTIVDLTGGPWRGPTATAMATAVLPFAVWLQATAVQAQHAGGQAKAAAVAYEAAFAMTVPPPVVAANRVQLMMLVATNFFGQNAGAIAATEAHYAAMWAQDAAAMYVYAGSSAAAVQSTPFTSPPQTTNPGGIAGQSAATTQAAGNSAGSQAMTTAQSLAQAGAATGTPTTPGAGTVPPLTGALQPWVDKLTQYTSLLNWGGGMRLAQAFPNGIMYSFSESGGMTSALREFGAGLAKSAEAAASKVGIVQTPGFGAATPSAALGRGIQIGTLSVPQSWPVAPNQAAATLVSSRAAAVAAGESAAARGGVFGMPGFPGAAAAGGAQGFRFVPRYGYRHKFMARPPSAG